jgi:hypothetical protein
MKVETYVYKRSNPVTAEGLRCGLPEGLVCFQKHGDGINRSI